MGLFQGLCQHSAASKETQVQFLKISLERNCYTLQEEVTKERLPVLAASANTMTEYLTEIREEGFYCGSQFEWKQ